MPNKTNKFAIRCSTEEQARECYELKLAVVDDTIDAQKESTFEVFWYTIITYSEAKEKWLLGSEVFSNTEWLEVDAKDIDVPTISESKIEELEMSNEVKKRILEYFKPPFRYDSHGTYVRDSENHMVVDIRWRWAIQYIDKPEEKQDWVWKLVTHLLNKYFAENK